MAANQEPTRHRAAAALLVAAKSAALATVNCGHPHASLVTPGWTAAGAPLLLLSTLALHTQYLQAAPACALLLQGPASGDNPQTTPRVSLSGTARPVVAAAAAARAQYLRAHPYAAPYAGFADFGFWEINVELAQYIGGFADAATLDVAALQHEISMILRGS